MFVEEIHLIDLEIFFCNNNADDVDSPFHRLDRNFCTEIHLLVNWFAGGCYLFVIGNVLDGGMIS